MLAVSTVAGAATAAVLDPALQPRWRCGACSANLSADFLAGAVMMPGWRSGAISEGAEALGPAVHRLRRCSSPARRREGDRLAGAPVRLRPVGLHRHDQRAVSGPADRLLRRRVRLPMEGLATPHRPAAGHGGGALATRPAPAGGLGITWPMATSMPAVAIAGQVVALKPGKRLYARPRSGRRSTKLRPAGRPGRGGASQGLYLRSFGLQRRRAQRVPPWPHSGADGRRRPSGWRLLCAKADILVTRAPVATGDCRAPLIPGTRRLRGG